MTTKLNHKEGCVVLVSAKYSQHYSCTCGAADNYLLSGSYIDWKKVYEDITLFDQSPIYVPVECKECGAEDDKHCDRFDCPSLVKA